MARRNPVREQFDFDRYEEYARRLSNDQLHYSIQDALRALDVARTWDDGGAGEAKYLDQLSVLRRERDARRARHNPEWARKVGGALYRGTRKAAAYTAEVGQDLYRGMKAAHGARKNPKISSCARAYLEAALETSTIEAWGDEPLVGHGEPYDRYFAVEDFSDKAIEQAEQDCESFMDNNDVGDLDYEEIGRNLWMTRNHHGTGFWDMGLGVLGQQLTKAAHAYGETGVVFDDDDGMLHLT